MHQLVFPAHRRAGDDDTRRVGQPRSQRQFLYRHGFDTRVLSARYALRWHNSAARCSSARPAGCRDSLPFSTGSIRDRDLSVSRLIPIVHPMRTGRTSWLGRHRVARRGDGTTEAGAAIAPEPAVIRLSRRLRSLVDATRLPDAGTHIQNRLSLSVINVVAWFSRLRTICVVSTPTRRVTRPRRCRGGPRRRTGRRL